jgi:hypothetical protein
MVGRQENVAGGGGSAARAAAGWPRKHPAGKTPAGRDPAAGERRAVRGAAAWAPERVFSRTYFLPSERQRFGEEDNPNGIGFLRAKDKLRPKWPPLWVLHLL